MILIDALNVRRVRMVDDWWAVLLALPLVLATAPGTAAVDRSIAGPLWLTLLLTAAACHGLRVHRAPVPEPCGRPLASQGTGVP